MFVKFLYVLTALLIILVFKYTVAYENDMHTCQKHSSWGMCEEVVGDLYYTVGGFAFGSKE